MTAPAKGPLEERDFIVTALDLDEPYRTTFVTAKTAGAARAKVARSALDAGWYGYDFGAAVRRLRVRVAERKRVRAARLRQEETNG